MAFYAGIYAYHGRPKKAAAVREEIADVLIYLVRLADVLKIDLLQVADQKVVWLNYENIMLKPVDVFRDPRETMFLLFGEASPLSNVELAETSV